MGSIQRLPCKGKKKVLCHFFFLYLHFKSYNLGYIQIKLYDLGRFQIKLDIYKKV